eukprot:1151689-Pelagomonas_calceolata.AAC.1
MSCPSVLSSFCHHHAASPSRPCVQFLCCPCIITWVLVLQTDRNRSRLTLSTKKLEPKPGDMLRDPQRVFENAAETFQKRKEAEGILDKYQPGDLVQGVVSSIKPFGAFVDLGEITGLLHISQISHERIVGVDQILQEGDQLKVCSRAMQLFGEQLSVHRASENQPRVTCRQFPSFA